jgi:putative FmdB family regulatory protein
MPLYEFYCADCRAKFEVLSPYAKVSAGDVVCQTCHGAHVRKLLSVFAARRGGDGEFGDSFDFADDASAGGGCDCGGHCSCGDH